MKRSFIMTYGIVSYFVFLATFLYLLCFIGDFSVPKTINSGPPSNAMPALLIDMGLILLFALQHLIMARGRFKKWLTRFVPQPMERSTFVLASSLCLVLLFMLWRPVPVLVWNVEEGLLRWMIHAAFFLGWGLVFYSSFLIDHFDLFGLRQVYLHYRGLPYSEVPFKVHSLYRYMRHPMMLGLLVAFWAVPVMTVGHFVLSAGFALFIFAGLWFEERDLAKHFGRAYLDYRRRTSMVIPMPKRRKVSDRPFDQPPGGSGFRCSDGNC